MSPDSCLSIHMYLRNLCNIHVSGFMSQHLYISGSSARSMSPDPYISIHMNLQDPCLQAHVSASLHVRILCKIHVFGFMSQHLRISGSSARSMCPIHVSGFMSQHPCVSQDPLQDPCCRIHSSAAICISGSSTRSTSSDSCLSIFVSHRFSARSTSPDTRLSIFVSQDPLRDPCLRIHVSASLYLRILYKIHVFGFMSQHPLIWILYKIHVFGFMSQHLCISGSSARSMSPDPYISIHKYLRILCKIHVSASICISGTSAISMSPIHVSASLYLRVLCKIHVSGFMSQHLCISGSSARSMSPDPKLSSHMYLRILCRSMSPGSCLSIFASQDPRQDPCLRIHVSASSYLRILCKIHVSASCLSIHVSASMCISGSSARSMLPDP